MDEATRTHYPSPESDTGSDPSLEAPAAKVVDPNEAAEREFFGGETLDEAEARQRPEAAQEQVEKTGDLLEGLGLDVEKINKAAEGKASQEVAKVQENIASLEKAAAKVEGGEKVVEKRRPMLEALAQRVNQGMDALNKLLDDVLNSGKDVAKAKKPSEVKTLVSERESTGVAAMPEPMVEVTTPEEESDAQIKKASAIFERATRREAAVNEVNANMQEIQTFVFEYFKERSPKELYTALRSGEKHPRLLMITALEQAELYQSKEPVPTDTEMMSGILPEQTRAGYALLRSDEIPSEHRKAAARIAHQLENRFFFEASGAANDLAMDLPEPLKEQVLELGKQAAETQREEEKRYDDLRQSQEQLYEALLSDPENAERRESIEARRQTEKIFAEGEMVGDLKGMGGIPYEGKGPAVATFKLGDEIRTGVVKFEFMDRFTRRGVTPGTGPMREVVGTMGYVGLGMDAVPPVVARHLQEFGAVSVTELIKGRPASRQENWFVQGDDLHPDIERLALADVIVGRLDGADRNIMVTPEGALVPIDFGSDISSSSEERIRSASYFAFERMQKTFSAPVQENFLRWQKSKAREVFAAALSQLPEDMSERKKKMDEMIEEITLSMVEDPERAHLPKYMAGGIDQRNSLGNRFTTDFPKFEKAKKQVA